MPRGDNLKGERPRGENYNDVVKLLAAGVAPPVIAADKGLSRNRIYQIRADAQKRGLLPEKETNAVLDATQLPAVLETAPGSSPDNGMPSHG